jgi:hypothetical protein
MPFPHTRHFSVTRCCRCFGQNRTSVTSGAAAVRPAPWLNRTCGAAAGGVGGADTTVAAAIGCAAGGETGAGGGTTTGCDVVAETGAGTGGEIGCGPGDATAGRSMRTAGAEGDGVAVAAGALTVIRGGAGGAAGAGAAFIAPGGGGAISVAGAVQVGDGTVAVGDTDNATGPVTFPNCRFTSSLIRADKSAPHSGHANVTGLRTISGEASNAYLPPQSHWIFICHQGLGFNNTTFVVRGSASADAEGDDFIPPSLNRKVPPYL